MDWLSSHWVQILAVIGAADGLFYAVTKLTKSEADDNIYAIVHGWVIKFFQPKQ